MLVASGGKRSTHNIFMLAQMRGFAFTQKAQEDPSKMSKE